MSVLRPLEPLLVTPNERLVRAHAEQHDSQALQAGRKTWDTLSACSWSTLVRELWEERLLAAPPRRPLPSLMNPWQERFLWIRVLEASAQGEWLLNIASAAKLAAEAWSLICAYELRDALWGPHLRWEVETRVLIAWVDAFLTRCQHAQWLDSAQLEAHLTSAIEEGQLSLEALPSRLDLRGFSELTPAQTRLLKALERLGVEVERQAPTSSREAVNWVRVAAPDRASELHLAARWIRHQLESAPTGSASRVALIVPDLSTAQAEVTRILDEVLQPSRLLAGQQDADRVYNLSLGQPLAHWPLVADALSLLELHGGQQPLEELGVLLHSPFLEGGESERDARALLEAKLLRDGAYSLRLERLANRAQPKPEAEAARPSDCPVLAGLLQRVLDRLRRCEPRLSPRAWSDEFRALLDLYGWPGERLLDSNEYQTLARFHEALAHLGSLEWVHPQLGRREAVLALRRIAEESVFQPERARGPIEVLGYLEAAGLPFEATWVVGMDDAAWPSAARPNPYLPVPLQRAHRLPHSSPERELEFAHSLIAQLWQGASQGVMSWAERHGDQPLRPSLLIGELPCVSESALPLSLSDPLPALLYRSREPLDEVLDTPPPAVDEGRLSRGGSAIFKLQATCPFRAFANLRLNARPLDTVETGLNASQRGNLMHHVLELFWHEAQSSAALHDWAEERRLELWERCVEIALEKAQRSRPDVLGGAFLQLERDRLRQFGQQWLEVESKRPAFTVVSTERQVEFEFGGLRLRAIIDRIDELEHGRRVVIDYKTGDVRSQSWLGPRPDEPQLPLYCVASPERFSALAFAKIRTGELSFTGMGEQDGLLPGVHHSERISPEGLSWLEQQDSWKVTLSDLAHDFRQGEAEVDPKTYPGACRNCGLETLCRVQPDRGAPQ